MVHTDRGRRKDLYETLEIPTMSTRGAVRRAVRRVRRQGWGGQVDRDTLQAACVAGHVLGDAYLRTEYNLLVERARAMGQPLPRVGEVVPASPLPPPLTKRMTWTVIGLGAHCIEIVAKYGATGLRRVLLPIGVFVGLAALCKKPSHRVYPNYNHEAQRLRSEQIDHPLRESFMPKLPTFEPSTYSTFALRTPSTIELPKYPPPKIDWLKTYNSNPDLPTLPPMG